MRTSNFIVIVSVGYLCGLNWVVLTWQVSEKVLYVHKNNALKIFVLSVPNYPEKFRLRGKMEQKQWKRETFTFVNWKASTKPSTKWLLMFWKQILVWLQSFKCTLTRWALPQLFNSPLSFLTATKILSESSSLLLSVFQGQHTVSVHLLSPSLQMPRTINAPDIPILLYNHQVNLFLFKFSSTIWSFLHLLLPVKLLSPYRAHYLLPGKF